MTHPFQLTGKNILVAGAATAIGQAIVDQLLNLGANVVMADKDENRLKEVCCKHQDDALSFFSFDLFDLGDIESAIKNIVRDYGAFDGFVYAAGMGGVRPLTMTKAAFTQNMINANVLSFIEMTRCVVRKGSFLSGGSIVAISSVSSIKGLKGKTAYCASKAALDSAVRAIAVELSDRRIRVNSILKGWVSSDMELDFIKINMELSKDEDLKKQLLGPVEPFEIANTTAFLLSDATKTITGTSLLVDGGYSL